MHSAVRPVSQGVPSEGRAETAEQEKPIELRCWPTPNGWKISIMLEEIAVPCEVLYVARASSSSRIF